LRDTEGKYSLIYKKWHHNTDGKSNYYDEYETPLDDIEQVRSIFKALGYNKIVTVDKNRKKCGYIRSGKFPLHSKRTW